MTSGWALWSRSLKILSTLRTTTRTSNQPANAKQVSDEVVRKVYDVLAPESCKYLARSFYYIVDCRDLKQNMAARRRRSPKWSYPKMS